MIAATEPIVKDKSSKPLSTGFGAAIKRTTSFRASASRSRATSIGTPNSMSPVSSSSNSRAASSGPLPTPTQSVSNEGKPRSRSVAPPAGANRKLAVTTSASSLLPLTSSSSGSAGGMIQQTQSQPATLRSSMMALLPHGSKVATPATSGASTPANGVAAAGAARTALSLPQLEASYVEKISIALGEAVNKVFLGGPVSVLLGPGEVVYKGRTAPKAAKAREFVDLITAELTSAARDTYLLRTLLRSSVTKSLSLFLTRLMSLTITGPDAACTAVPATPKVLEAIPIGVRYNLQVMRCAVEVKMGLQAIAAANASFVGDSLKPWIHKFDEIEQRIINPVILSFKIAIRELLEKERDGKFADVAATGPAVKHLPTAGQLKTLTKAPGGATQAATTASVVDQARHAPSPAWVVAMGHQLDAFVAVVNRLDCRDEGKVWLANIGTFAVWKGMLFMSAKRYAEEDISRSTTSATDAVAHANGTSFGIFKGKKNPSPPTTPPAGANLALQGGAAAKVFSAAHVHLLQDVLSFETQLNAFVSALGPDIIAPAASLGTCAADRNCARCKMSRTFDPESDDEDEDPTGAVALAHYAMREAMQALSAMAVVVESMGDVELLTKHLLESAEEDIPPLPVVKPLAPGDLFAMGGGAVAAPAPVPEKAPVRKAFCPTLMQAIENMPTLVLLHLVASRIPPSTGFRLPHQIWGMSFSAYARELRGFKADEEFAVEVASELTAEVDTISASVGENTRVWLDLLDTAAETMLGLELKTDDGASSRFGSLSTTPARH